MNKALLTIMVMCVLVFSFSTPVSSQEAPAPQKVKKQATQKQARWEGMVVRHSADKQMLTVRKRGSTQEREIHYDSSTQFVSQEHGSKKANPIDASDIKDADRVICVGQYDDKSNFHAKLISKRLTN